MRQIPRPTVSLPIACRSVGFHSLFAGWQNRPTFKNCVELFWCVRGRGRFLLEGQELIVNSGQALVLLSERVHDFKAITHFEMRWMTLDGEMSDAVVKVLGAVETPFQAGPCPEPLFDRLCYEIEDITPRGQLAASATAYEILTLAYSRRDEPRSSHVRQCLELIRRNYASSDVNVGWLARKVGIHRTNLSKLFQERMRVSPIEYLTLFRVSRALKMLQQTNLPIGHIAAKTGFSCPSYFTNVIRKRTGLSPQEIRAQRISRLPRRMITTKL